MNQKTSWVLFPQKTGGRKSGATVALKFTPSSRSFYWRRHFLVCSADFSASKFPLYHGIVRVPTFYRNSTSMST